MQHNDMTNRGEDKILIVDDNPTNLKVLFDYLGRDKAHKIFIAKNGREALERAAYALPDIILLDIMMPEMDGYETCQKLKENDATREIPVIFLTAVSDIEDKVKAFETGAVDFIVKPFNQEEVLVRIKTHLTISRQKKAIEKANRELAKANATKDKLFSIVAHDMRNKLMGITGNIQLLENYYKNFSDEEREETLADLSDSAGQMHRLFESLFVWARMQTGDIRIIPESVDLSLVCDEVAALYAADARSVGVEVASRVPAGFTVVSDRDMLSFVLRNLVQNAVKACGKGSRVEMTCAEEKTGSRVSVTDNGPGMPRETREAILDLTAEAPRSKGKTVGSGLGLVVAKEFAELNGGTLSVISEKGEGTEVRVVLPAPQT